MITVAIKCTNNKGARFSIFLEEQRILVDLLRVVGSIATGVNIAREQPNTPSETFLHRCQ